MLYIEDKRRANNDCTLGVYIPVPSQATTIEGDNDCKEVNGNQLSALVIQPGIIREGCTQGRLH